MKFLADENFPYASAKLLQEAGHDVEHMGLIGPGSDDHHVIKYANASDRTILTFDSDISTIAVTEGRPVEGGIVLFRLMKFSPETPGQMLIDYLNADVDADLTGKITVFDPPRVRQRRISYFRPG